MSTARINVWVQSFKGRKNLMLQWFDPTTGARKSQSAETADPEEAETARGDLEYKLNHGLHYEPSSITWAKFRELFEREYCKGLRDRSQEKFATVFDVMEAEMNPGKLAVMDERFMSQFKVKLQLRERPLSAAKRKAGEKPRTGLEPITIRNYLVNLKTAMKWAADQSFIAKVPKFPHVRVAKTRPTPIPAETYERLLEAEPDPYWKVFLLCGWWAGLRLSEAYALRWTHSERFPWLDLAQGRLVLPAKFAKSNEDQWVPLHDELRNALAALDRTNDRVFNFISYRTKGPLTRSGVTSHVLMIAKRAGVRLSMHKLRKGFGCRAASLLGKGRAAILHRLMRHSSMQITMDYYANVDDALSEAMSELK